MPYHNDKDIYKSKEDISKEKKERKPSKMSFFEPLKISKEDMKKLKEHSKLHKGGMDSKHMKNMKKIMKQGKTFSQAHKEAKILDKKRK